ncbi:MAG: esterase [Muribaculaceae bacterium]|nr:esterase [Muribaculaceae bacterium]
MKLRVFTLSVAFFFALVALSADDIPQPEKYKMTYGDTVRTYSMYLPPSISQGAPLVVYTHGYGSKTRWREDLNAVADSCGFAVCYPDGLPDSRGYDSWNVGYPSQDCMRVDEADFFSHLLDEVTARFGLSKANVFMAGWSNGGDLCYHLAFTDPGLFRAYGSVGGLMYENLYKNNNLTVPVSFIEIHGNSDDIAMWQGDHQNAGGWGAYIPVPLAVAALAAHNRCTTMAVDTFPNRCDPSRVVNRTSYSGSPSECDVIIYEIDGGKHSWAEEDVNTSRILWDFFSRYMTNENRDL